MLRTLGKLPLRFPKLHSTMTTTLQYDILFLGSGQSANPLAKLFAQSGRKTAVVERATLGGTCVNVGCTPTKTMIASGRAAYLARRGADYGVRTGEISVDMEKVRQRKRDIVERWHDGSVKGLEGAGVDIFMGQASFVDEKKVKVVLNDGGEKELTADTVFVSVGERPSSPDIPGLGDVDASRVLNSTTIMELDVVPKHLVVVGGGYIGMEFGQLFRRLGAEVTVLQRGKQLLPREDPEVAACLLDIVKEDGMTIHLSSSVESVAVSNDANTPLKVRFQTETEAKDVGASHILLAAGRVPNTDGLNLPAAGIKTTGRGHVIVNDKLQTSAPKVYALGDCHGGPAFTHISYDDFRVIRNNLLPETLPPTTPQLATTDASISRVLVPYVVYTDPQLGHIGQHERDFELGSDRKVKTASMPMSYVARALETDESRGMMKATVDAETGEILGFTCLGLEGGEVMSIMQAAMMGKLKWWDLEAAVWAHPTLAESLNNLWGHFK